MMKKLRDSNGHKNKKSLAQNPLKQKNTILLVATLLFAFVGASFLVKSFAASTTLYLTPTTSNVSLDANFTVTIRVNSGTEAINTVQANLNYDANKLQFMSIDSSTSAFPTEVEATGGNGVVKIARAKTVTSLTGDQLVAVVSFKAISTGATPVIFA